MEIKTFYKIRFSDCDSFRHLHNSGYIDYMLNAREDHLKDFHDISMTALYEKSSGWMVNKHEIVYLSPALYNENVCIKSDLIKLTGDSLLVEMSMWDTDQKQLKALLWTKFIHINMQTARRDDHPDWFMQLAAPLENKVLQQANSVNERLSMLVKR
jgi:YbgC/YbaW family acyl-CoA thioester hydrolase